jgi:hypothetical protein
MWYRGFRRRWLLSSKKAWKLVHECRTGACLLLFWGCDGCLGDTYIFQHLHFSSNTLDLSIILGFKRRKHSVGIVAPNTKIRLYPNPNPNQITIEAEDRFASPNPPPSFPRKERNGVLLIRRRTPKTRTAIPIPIGIGIHCWARIPSIPISARRSRRSTRRT